MTFDELGKISDWFDRFVDGFKSENRAVQRNYDLKIEHSKLVRENIDRLSISIGMSAEDRALASAIAICHDVGRFPQYRDYGTFNDATSFNHGALAVRTLKTERILENLPQRDCNILYQAVALHNAFILPDNLDQETMRFTRLIRDADKLDIWRVLVEFCIASPEERASAVTWELPDTGSCSPGALAEVIAGRMLNRSLLATADDFKLLQLSWVFDLNFVESGRILAEQGHINRLAQLLPAQPGCREVIEVVEKHLASNIIEFQCELSSKSF